ncbi:MAG: CHRD domain-containing protein [Actinobacteria bacterium]|nr:CHRD domain-containing protein [Actinomycetota bacterium]
MKKLGFLALFVAGGALVVSGVSLARGGDDDGKRASARLVGYNETPSISTTARGTFEARVADGKITFRLRYEGLEGGNATQAHLHLGQRHTAGGISAFLCGGSVKPACPAGSATIEGTIVPSDVIGPGGQGIAPGQFDELVAAIRAGAVYANVHTPTYPAGEVRGQLRGHKGKEKGDDRSGKDD